MMRGQEENNIKDVDVDVPRHKDSGTNPSEKGEKMTKSLDDKKNLGFVIKRECKIIYNIVKETFLHPFTYSLIEKDTGNVVKNEEYDSSKQYIRV